MVASLYHHLRPYIDRHPELKLTLEKRFREEDRRIDIVIRKRWQWWVAFECKLEIKHENPGKLKKDTESLLWVKKKERDWKRLFMLPAPIAQKRTSNGPQSVA